MMKVAIVQHFISWKIENFRAYFFCRVEPEWNFFSTDIYIYKLLKFGEKKKYAQNGDDVSDFHECLSQHFQQEWT